MPPAPRIGHSEKEHKEKGSEAMSLLPGSCHKLLLTDLQPPKLPGSLPPCSHCAVLPQRSLCSHPATGWPQPSSGEGFILVCSCSETHQVHRQALLWSHTPAHPTLHSVSRQPHSLASTHTSLRSSVLHLPPSHTRTFPQAVSVSPVSPLFPPKLHLMKLLCPKATNPSTPLLSEMSVLLSSSQAWASCAGRF